MLAELAMFLRAVMFLGPVFLGPVFLGPMFLGPMFLGRGVAASMIVAVAS